MILNIKAKRIIIIIIYKAGIIHYIYIHSLGEPSKKIMHFLRTCPLRGGGGTFFGF